MVDRRRLLVAALLASMLLAGPPSGSAQEDNQSGKSTISEAATPPPTLEPLRKPGSPAPFVAFSVPTKQTSSQPAAPVTTASTAASKPVQVHAAHSQNTPTLRSLWRRITQPRHHAVKPVASVAAAPSPVHERPAPVAAAPSPVHERPEPVAAAPSPVHERPAPVAAAPSPIHERSAPVAAPPAPAPADTLDAMTRDGSHPASTAEAGGLNPITQAIKTAGALAIGLIVVVLVVNLLRRYRGFIEGFRKAQASSPLPKTPSKGRSAKSIANFLGGHDETAAGALVANALGAGTLEVLNSQSLPGSGSVVYLVKAADRMMLLGASHQGGVRTLAEWDIEETQSAIDKDAAFDAYLEAQGVIKAPTPSAEAEVRAVRSRLHEATGRLAHRGGHDSGELE
ncbi:MAG: hypothetical protein P4L33_02250 [Capsulimonadaceae bacterium]|nr:hypothetical protein [Capsulimonadaceae bacterium]